MKLNLTKFSLTILAALTLTSCGSGGSDNTHMNKSTKTSSANQAPANQSSIPAAQPSTPAAQPDKLF